MIEEKVWVILRSNTENGKNRFGICGTGFFIKPNTFITAHHFCSKKIFIPNKNWNDNFLILKSPNGTTLEVIEENCIFDKDKDITYIKLQTEQSFFDLDNASIGENVFNIGYPTRINKSIPSQQEGKVTDIREHYSCEFSNGCIKNKKVLFLDYISEEGFSGGPLLNQDNKVVGIMSNVSYSEMVTKVVSSSEF